MDSATMDAKRLHGPALAPPSIAMRNLKRILVPTDFSSGSKRALELAVEMAQAFGASVHVIHIWEPSPYVSPDALVWLNSEQKSFWEHVKATCEMRLASVVAEATNEVENAPTISWEVVAGYTTESILAVASSGSCQLIVMGTHGRRGLKHVMLGSVAERVVRACPCPVMTVRAEDPPAEDDQPDDETPRVFETPTML
jgi:universal stress protein A